MLFARKHHEYGCPMCGRLPVIKALQTEKYNESRKVKTLLTVYRLECPRGHIATTSLPDLNKYYEDMGASQPLPKPECESSILAALAD